MGGCKYKIYINTTILVDLQKMIQKMWQLLNRNLVHLCHLCPFFPFSELIKLLLNNGGVQFADLWEKILIVSYVDNLDFAD